MLAEAFRSDSLLDRLPKVRGSLTPDAPLADQTWFRVGGPAEVLFKPADEEDLVAFLSDCPKDVPITVLGVASNTLVRDGGVRGVVIKLGPVFAQIVADGTFVTAGSAAIDLNVARAAQVAGIAGLEFLSGIPGTVGGGVRMNAGAYGSEFKDIVENVKLVDRSGKIRTASRNDIHFSYRHSDFPEDVIFLSAHFRGAMGDKNAIKLKMDEIQKARAETQPIREKTGGSTFANPDSHKSWQLIEAAGCRGLKVGGAQMSEKHCNFLINTGNAIAADIENLGEEVRRRVKDKSGIELRWEIKRIGMTKEERGL